MLLTPHLFMSRPTEGPTIIPEQATPRLGQYPHVDGVHIHAVLPPEAEALSGWEGHPLAMFSHCAQACKWPTRLLPVPANAVPVMPVSPTSLQHG